MSRRRPTTPRSARDCSTRSRKSTQFSGRPRSSQGSPRLRVLPGQGATAPGSSFLRTHSAEDHTDVLEHFLTRYANPGSRDSARGQIQQLLRQCSGTPVQEITDSQITAWITGPGANNTVRRRLSVARTFWRWCIQQGYVTDDPTVHLDYLTKQYPKTYGKVQASYPARWLTQGEAATLTASCNDGTLVGLRDELVIRLGLLGMRNTEIRNLRIADLHVTETPAEIRWMGKGRRARKAVPGRTLLDTLTRYLRLWDRTPEPHDHLICAATVGRTRNEEGQRLRWGVPIAAGHQLAEYITKRAESADLGHVTTHDLRRSAAGILHHAKTPDGGHLFDLLDIQKVLGHADPATTQRSYLDPLDSGVIARAGDLLDC